MLCILESHIAIAQNGYETHSTCDIAHTSVTVISQLHHMNSIIDIHTTHFSNRSRIHKNRTVRTSLQITILLRQCFLALNYLARSKRRPGLSLILIYFEEILALNTYLHLIIGVRVALVVAFGILPENFGRWWGPTNGNLLFYECRLSGGDTMSW